MSSDHHDGEKYFCPCCEYRSNRSDNVIRHFACGVHRFGFACGLCGEVAPDRAALQEHVESAHFEGGLYYCPHCDHTTKYRANIHTHVRRVHNRCQNCNIEYDSREQFREHLALVHSKPHIKDKHKCKLCPFKCKNLYTLKRHRIEAHGDTNIPIHKCSRCDYVSPRRYAVVEHERVVHDGQRGLSCEYCDYSTREKMNLAVHLQNKHGIGEVPYLSCPHCPYKNRWRKNLQAHVKMRHQGYFRHNCKECAFASNDAVSYKMHRVRVHGLKDVKTFDCTRCSYTTFKRDNLRRHEKAVHDKVRFKCERCPYSTKEMSRLRKHICSGSLI